MQQKILLSVIGVLLLGAGVFGYMQFAPHGSADIPVTRTSVTEGLPNEEETMPSEIPSEENTATGPTTYTLAQISSHNSASDCYTAISGKVYNLTSFVNGHPGGEAILKICGKDGTATFTAQHGGSPQQAQILATLVIGVLAK